MYIVEKKEKIKINDVDNVEPFTLFGKELDFINQVLVVCIIGGFIALGYVCFFYKESPEITPSPVQSDSAEILLRSSNSEPVTSASLGRPSSRASSRKSKNQRK
jgi:hypothetical protein